MTFRDIRLAVRTLVLDRSVSVVVILCLALGIGVNATLFSVIDGVLIQPLPFPQADHRRAGQLSAGAARDQRGSDRHVEKIAATMTQQETNT